MAKQLVFPDAGHPPIYPPIHRPAFRYLGGKWQLSKRVISHFPAHTTYVEPFGGAFSLGLRKQPACHTVYNDLNPAPVQFFRQLQRQPGALITAIDTLRGEPSLFELCQYESDDPILTASAFYLLCQLSFSGGGGRWSGGTTAERLAQVQADSADYLYGVADRIKAMDIKNLDALRLFSWDSTETLFYVDPPYPGQARGSKDARHSDPVNAMPRRQYQFEYTDEQHAALAQRLHRIKGMAVVSGVDCPLYRDLFGDWTRVELPTQTGARTAYTECLWLSPRVVAKRPPEHFLDAAPAQAQLEQQLSQLQAERDRIRSEGAISPPGTYIERYKATRRRKKTGPVVYFYYRLRNPSGGGARHQSLGKQGSVKYLGAIAAIQRRNQLSALERQIKALEGQQQKH